MSVVTQRYQFTVDDFARMLDAGIIEEHERVELIDGEVRQMFAIGPLHIFLVNRLTAILTKQLSDRAIVSVQNSVVLNDFTQPQPDFVILRLKEDFYKDALARPNDVHLIIEVADSSLEYDRDEKVPRYAQMRIPEVWLVDANAKEVTQYARPDAGAYQRVRPFGPDEELKSVEIESLSLSINDLFLLGR
jgi:Uma2 family endonuclease